MTTAVSSSLFRRLVGAWRCLQLRSDIDSIVLELLGRFSLEKIYADANVETYQNLVLTLLAQLNTIFYIQRMSLPSEAQSVGGWYLGFLASWEVTLRTLDFVLQVILEGRESLWEVRPLRDKYLAELLLSCLRVLTLHPRAPPKLKERRDRFARIHRAVEQVHDSYPGPESFLLSVCKEVTARLRAEPNTLALPSGYELPNLASELYPLADSLTPKHVYAIVPQDSYSSDWLSEFLTLRDISHFIVGASVQYTANRETRAVGLREYSAMTRNAVLGVLEQIQMPQHLSKLDLLATFSETFQIALPDTPVVSRRGSSELQIDEYEIDAIDALCSHLSSRQMIQRVSDRELMQNISEVTRNIALLDDPSGQFRATRPRLYVQNCSKCHIAGDSQMRYAGEIIIQSDVEEGAEINRQSKCIQCGETITAVREISLARQAWELLKPLEPNADTISAERHLPSKFQLTPSKSNGGMPFGTGYNGAPGFGGRSLSHDADVPSSRHGHHLQLDSNSPGRSYSVPQPLVPQHSPGFRQKLGTPRTEPSIPEDIGPLDTPGRIDTQIAVEMRRPSNAGAISPLSPSPFSPNAIESHGASAVDSPLSPFSPEFVVTRKAIPPRPEHPALLAPTPVSAEPPRAIRARTVPSSAVPEKGRSGWRSKFTVTKKETHTTSRDSSTLSSTTLEFQKLEEIPLKNLVSARASARGRSAKKVHVYLSENSTNALFWTQVSIHLWDVGTSPPTPKRLVSTESTCVLAAVTKVYLAYIIGTRDQKLTLRIMNLLQPTAPVVEYRIPSSPWCTSLTICPKENYVVLGFEGSTIRTFSTTNTEQPREDRLHKHSECKQCPSVETLSFSNNGLMLLASTRHQRNGVIQVYSSRFPFIEFQEVQSCRYPVKLHESEDGGVTSAIFRPGLGYDENLICITTWTQSGTPLLVQPESNHTSAIRAEPSGRSSDKLGSRIQCAAFSPSGRALMMVNDRGYLFHIRNLNSNPLSVRRVATSRELTGKSESFAMAFMTLPLPDDEAVVLAWADPSKAMGYVKKIPMMVESSHPSTPGVIHATLHRTELPCSPAPVPFLVTRSELPADAKVHPKPSAELPTMEYI